jgi:hypothetical protein
MVSRVVPADPHEVRTKLLAASAGLCVVLAGLLVILAPLLLKAPTTVHRQTRSTGPAVFLDRATGQVRPGTFEQVSTLRPHSSGTAVASYDQIATQTFLAGGVRTELSRNALTQAFDRSTGTGRPGVQGDTVGTTAHLFKLPFTTQHRGYRIWDDTAHKAVDLVYVRDRTVGGLPVLEFRRDVGPTDLGVLPVFRAVPGAWVGHPELPSIPAHEWYENTDTALYVEPVTGSLVGGRSSPHVWAQTTGQLAGLRVELLKVTGATPVEADAAALVAAARTAKSKVETLRRAPWVLGGLAFLLAGLALLTRRPDVQEIEVPAPRQALDDEPSEVPR